LLKERLILAPLFALPNYTKTFEIEYDASSIGIEQFWCRKMAHSLF
jgi:hypothetical protein